MSNSISTQPQPGVQRDRETALYTVVCLPVRDDARSIADVLKILLTDNRAWSIQSSAQVEFAKRFFTRDAMSRSVLAALDAVKLAVDRLAGAACLPRRGS